MVVLAQLALLLLVPALQVQGSLALPPLLVPPAAPFLLKLHSLLTLLALLVVLHSLLAPVVLLTPLALVVLLELVELLAQLVLLALVVLQQLLLQVEIQQLPPHARLPTCMT